MVLHLALGGRGGVPINFKGSPPREGGLFKRGSLEGGAYHQILGVKGLQLTDGQNVTCQFPIFTEYHRQCELF